MSDAERKLWNRIRKRQIMRAKFRRQHIIAPYIVDFACIEHSLIIELDGGQHDERSYRDALRTKYLSHLGWRVVRFWNFEVFENMSGVLDAISSLLAPPS